MMMTRPPIRSVAVASAFLAVVFTAAAHAVILAQSANRNTSAPTGGLSAAGWDLQGRWRGFLGTPISKKFFVTAGHAGGTVGTKFFLGSRVFTTTAMWDDPNSDLRIYSVNKKFDAWAPMYTGEQELGKYAILFGRGTQRGAEVRVNGALKGWEWGTDDQVQSWGINRIDEIVDGNSAEGKLLQADFDLVGVDGEGIISAGDSGGGAFIYNKATRRYELAGVNYAVDGPYKRILNGPDFNAALFDQGGLYNGNAFISDPPADKPSQMFISRISSAQTWIDGVFSGRTAPTSQAQRTTQGVPEPASAGLIAMALVALARRRARLTEHTPPSAPHAARSL